MGLGVGTSNAHFQGSMGGTSTPYNTIPCGRGHIPPSSPSLGGAPQHPIRPNMNYSLFKAGSLGPSSYTTSVGSIPSYLLVAFGNNSFSSSSISARGNPSFGQQNPVQGTIPTQGENKKVFSSQGFSNPWQGAVYRQRCRLGETPSMVNGTSSKAQYLCLSDRQGATLSKIFRTQHREQSPPNPQCPITEIIR
jgi:hypothetical protein